MRVHTYARVLLRMVAKKAKEKEGEREREREREREGGSESERFVLFMKERRVVCGETFSSIPTARATPLSLFPYLPSLFLVSLLCTHTRATQTHIRVAHGTRA